MTRETPLIGWHSGSGARLVEFGGWRMPLCYTSIADEHHAVRQRAGLFDISHMGRLSFAGPNALEWLEHVTTNRVARLAPGAIQYSLMTDEFGGIIDDILVYGLPSGFLVVCNASNRESVVAQMNAHRPPNSATTELVDRTLETAMIAIQGPLAQQVAQPLCSIGLSLLRYYHCNLGSVAGQEAVISRTGYTGEDGFEFIVDARHAQALWQALLDEGVSAGVVACGLGARDTLRFEAGMPLYGHELDRTINPYEAGLGWAVRLDKGPFVGADALQAVASHPARSRMGLALVGKRIARQGAVVLRGDEPVGVVTSGTFSPTLERSLAMALIRSPRPEDASDPLVVDVRGQREPAQVVPLPFYRRPRPAAGSSPAGSS